MVYTGQVKPINKIVVAGDPMVQELKVEVAANMYPGRLVKKGTADDDVVVSDSTTGAAIVGWLGFEQTNPAYRPGTPTTIYTINDQAAVLNGDFILVAHLDNGQSVAKGAELTAAADGELTAATIGTHRVIAIAEESVNAGAGAKTIMVRSVL